MSYAPRIVLRLPLANPTALPDFIDACLRDKVVLIAIAGPGCAEMENVIDDLIIGDGTDESRFIATSSHPGETMQDVVDFASIWSDPRPGVQVVTL